MRSVVFAEDLEEKAHIAIELTLRMPQLCRDPALYVSAIPKFLESTDCDFMVALDDGEPCALGLFVPYDLPMAARRLLGVEALCFRDQVAEEQFWIWARLLDHARKKQFAGLCMTTRSLNTPEVLSTMATHGGIATASGDQYDIRWDKPLLQRRSVGSYSAFTEGPLTEAIFEANCLVIIPIVAIDWHGVSSQGTLPLYRGEGRLKVSGAWDCPDYPALIEHFRHCGFPPRKASGRFSGTLPEQILQQGYVNQPTVSLTESPEVAAVYARSGKAEGLGVIFTIDRARLSCHGPVYDSLASLRRSVTSFFKSEFETLSTVVTILGVGEGGNFLDGCHREIGELVKSGVDMFASPPEWPQYFAGGAWERLVAKGIREGHLDSLFHAFRGFWLYALSSIGTEDRIRLSLTGGDPVVSSKPVDPLAYFHAFDRVRTLLENARASATDREPFKRDPGWQTTAFGYIAKTCRDREFFSTGTVPGDCIVETEILS